MTLRIMSAICFDIALCLFNLFPCVNTTSQIGFTASALIYFCFSVIALWDFLTW